MAFLKDQEENLKQDLGISFIFWEAGKSGGVKSSLDVDDIYDQRIPIYPAPVHFKKGVYKFAITHTMRADPLPNILSTGIRVEKAKQ